ncbi:MAG: hypothetical protein FJW30_11345 [Acidobacteria bacterium]|nr:hypothetical protein [Acidobacteriota bacterium]
MKRILMTLLAGAVLSAQPNYRGGGSYTYSPAARIERGIHSGLITHREADKLWRMERELRYETEKAYRSGRGLSHGEARRLARMRECLDNEISKQLRDGERYNRGGYSYRRW